MAITEALGLSSSPRTRGERGIVFGPDGGQVAGEEWIERCARFGNYRSRGFGQQVGGANPGVIAQRDLFGFDACEPSDGLGWGAVGGGPDREEYENKESSCLR
jgi:hypothetical protein